MNTPTQMKRLSASSTGITPSATLSATAMATACCAGPNICTACLAPLIVTLLNITVAGLATRLGPTTESSAVKPSLLLARQLANAVSAALPRGPMIRSTWATSLPSPTSDSPTQSLVIFFGTGGGATWTGAGAGGAEAGSGAGATAAAAGAAKGCCT